jgi:hypothetical protein
MTGNIREKKKKPQWLNAIISLRKHTKSCTPVAHACNPSYSEGKDQEDRSLKPASTNSSWDTVSRKLTTKKGWESGSRPGVKTPVLKIKSKKQTKKKTKNKQKKKTTKKNPQKTQKDQTHKATRLVMFTCNPSYAGCRDGRILDQGRPDQVRYSWEPISKTSWVNPSYMGGIKGGPWSEAGIRQKPRPYLRNKWKHWGMAYVAEC